MLEYLIEWDIEVLKFVNRTFTNDFFDWILPVLRDKYIWVPLYVFMLSFLWVNHKIEGFIISLFVIAAVGISDFTSSSIIKELVERPRPCNADLPIHVDELIGCGSGFSFTSSHAANHFSLASVLSLLFGGRFKWLAPVLYIWAFLISYAQVYVGVHYPLDIIAGAVLGIIIGKVVGISAQMLTGFRP